MSVDTSEITPQQGAHYGKFKEGDLVVLTAPNGSTFHAKLGNVFDDNSFYFGRLDGVGRPNDPSGNSEWTIEPAVIHDWEEDYHTRLASTPRGSYIYVVEAGDDSVDQFVGKVVKTVEHDRSDFVRIPFDGPDGDFGAAPSKWIVMPTPDPEPEVVRPSEEVGIITDLQGQVRSLTNERNELLHQLRRANERVDERTGHGTDAFEVIGTRFWKEAESRGWCSEADGIINEINDELESIDSPWRIKERPRPQPFEFEAEVRGEMVTRVPFTVMALTREEAEGKRDEVLRDVRSFNRHRDNAGQGTTDPILTDAARDVEFVNVSVEAADDEV